MAKSRFNKRQEDAGDGIDVSLDLVASSFLGTLPAADAVTVRLTGAFAEIYTRFEQLRSSYFSGEINKTAFGRALAELRYQTADGSEWMLGATSGQWYRRTQVGGSWVATPIEQGLSVEAETRRRSLGGASAPQLASVGVLTETVDPGRVDSQNPQVSGYGDALGDEVPGGYGSSDLAD